MNTRNDVLRHFPKLLGRWEGTPGRMLRLTDSHQALDIVVERGEPGENLLISCLGPVVICGPVRWKSSSIGVKADPESDGYLVYDDTSKLRVVCEHVEIKENVKNF